MTDSGEGAAGALWRLSASALAELLRSGEVSSRDAVSGVIQRIAAVNPRVNAVTRVLDAEALAAADRADAERLRGVALGPLHGLPVSVKENVDVAGSPTTQGARALRDARPERDAAHVGLLKAAGAIVVSRTNLSEFAMRWDTDNELHGPTVNPWRPALSAGGSSGGEAVAVATGMSPLGFGNEDGASLRFPAQCEGICALKPSRGRVRDLRPRSPAGAPDASSLHVHGPMARCVADLRLALSVIGPAAAATGWAQVGGSPRRQRPRVALSSLAGVAAQVADGVRLAARYLEQAGYLVVEADLPRVEEAAQAAHTLSMWSLRSEWGRLSPMLSNDGRRHAEMMLSLAGTTTAQRYEDACAAQERIAQDWREFLDRYPLALGPVSTQPPFARGADREAAGLEAITESMAAAVAVNLVGVPAVVVPVGIGDGLPQVAQITGAWDQEDLCLAAAEAIEEAAGALTPIEPRS